MKTTRISALTKVLAMMLCVVMLAGVMSSCFNDSTLGNTGDEQVGNNDVKPDDGKEDVKPDDGKEDVKPDDGKEDVKPDDGKEDVKPDDGKEDVNPDDGKEDVNPDDGNEDVNPDDGKEDVNPDDGKEEENGFSASTELEGGSLIYGALANDVTIGDSAGVNALVPADVKIADGTSSLALSVKPVEGDAGIALGEGESVQGIDVHISGVAADNKVPMIVNLGAVVAAGISNTGLKLYHIENGTPVLMTKVDNAADFSIHNQYTYNAETGEISIYVASFSVIAAVQTSVDEWNGTSDTTWYNDNDTEFTLTTAEQFAGFRELVDGGNTFAGKTIKLGTDIDLANKLFDPIGYGYANSGGQAFMGTFDGAGHTVYNLYQNGWELGYSYSTAGGGLFASIMDATIKNLTINGAEIVMECIDMGTVVGYAQGSCHFENIIVTNAKLANYQRYTGGVVGEVSNGSYGTDVTKGYSHTFKNVTVDSSVKISSLWGDFDNACGGVIGGKWGNATVKMENVIVACEIDAFSDVTAAYQWYAYRRCGMLIGHTEQNSPKKALNAAAEFLTCVNVNVYYGDWVNYTYYQFTNQDNAWQNNYPWVRAQAGEHNGAFSNVRYGNPVIGGVAINTLELAESHKTGFAQITFNQLYGGGQGVYGAADHAGVNISYSLPKTFYFENNLGWQNLKLYYTYNNGEDTWTTVVDGIELVESNGVYRVDLPVGATSFTITADGGYESKEFVVSELTEKKTYLIHEHEFVDNKCACGAAKISSNVNILDYANANGWVNDKQYKEVVIGGIKVTAVGGGNTGKYYTTGNNWRIYQSENATVVITSESGNIVSVKITYVSEKTGVLTYNGSNVESGMLVDVNANSITFAVGNTGSATNGQVRITAIEVVYILENHECNQNEVVKGKEATCTETGLTDGAKCDICGKITLEQEIIPVGEHAWNDATCTSPQTCSVCGATEGDSLGHTTENGVCDNCGQTIGGTTPDPETPTKSGWIETELANIKPTDVVVIVLTTSNGTSYAISNDKGTSAAPTAIVVTIDGNKLSAAPADNIKWNISNDGGNLTIYPNGTTATWLYCTSTNNGVRVGTNSNKTFTIDTNSGYLKHTGTSRYLGVYTTNPDVRCYTSTTTNIENQTLAFYVYNEGTSGGTTEPVTPANPTTLAKFELGANGSASHSDGSEKSTYSETVNGYTLSITGGSKMYTGARDAKGNSALKLGTGSVAGKFTFTVPDNVTKVIIYVAQYKANTTKITVNGTSYTITTASNNGAYTAIEIDTSTTKTISFTTVSGGYRAMVNAIEFIGIAQ